MLLTQKQIKTESLIRPYGRWIVNHPVIVLLLSLLLLGVTGSGVLSIKFKNDYRYFFGRDNPQLASFEALQNIYTKNDNILIAIEPQDGAVFTPSFLEVVKKFTVKAWKTPYATRVDSITNFQHTRVVGDDLYVNPLVEDVDGTLSNEQLNAIGKTAMNEPLLLNRLISDDGRVTGINITLGLDNSDFQAQTEAVVFIRNLIDDFKSKYPNVDFHLTGLVALSNALLESSMADIQKLVPVMYAVILGIMVFMLRSIAGTLSTMCIVLFSILTAMGISGWLRVPITPPSSAAPTMIMTLAVGDCIHLIVAAFNSMRRGVSKKNAIVDSMASNFQPVFLTSFTTMIGFLSMNFSDAPPLRDLGNISAAGVVFAFLYALTFLPALLSLLPMRIKQKSTTSRFSMGAFADFVIKRHRAILVVFILSVSVTSIFAVKNDLNDDWIQYFDKSISFRNDTDFIHDNLTGIYQIEYSLFSGENSGIHKPDFLNKVDQYARWWSEQPNVLHVNSMADIFKRLNKNMHNDDPAYYKIPESRELAAQYLLLYEMSLPYGLDLNNQINVDKSSLRLTVTMADVTTRELKQAALEGEKWLRTNAPEYMFSEGTGTSVLFAHISERNINGMIKGTLLALLFISATLVFPFKSFKYGALSIIPNLIPSLTAFGLWGIWVGEINMAVSVVAAMTLGIVVDDTVYLMCKYIKARKENHSNVEDSIRYALSSVGLTLISTSAILFSGFLVLSFSAFAVNSGMGKLCAIIIVLALVCDLLFLPALIIGIEKRREKELSAPMRIRSDVKQYPRLEN